MFNDTSGDRAPATTELLKAADGTGPRTDQIIDRNGRDPATFTSIGITATHWIDQLFSQNPKDILTAEYQELSGNIEPNLFRGMAHRAQKPIAYLMRQATVHWLRRCSNCAV